MPILKCGLRIWSSGGQLDTSIALATVKNAGTKTKDSSSPVVPQRPLNPPTLQKSASKDSKELLKELARHDV